MRHLIRGPLTVVFSSILNFSTCGNQLFFNLQPTFCTLSFFIVPAMKVQKFFLSLMAGTKKFFVPGWQGQKIFCPRWQGQKIFLSLQKKKILKGHLVPTSIHILQRIGFKLMKIEKAG